MDSPKTVNGVKWTPDAILSEILRASSGGVVSSVDVGPTVAAMARRRFGSFDNACKAINILSASKAKPAKLDICCIEGCCNSTGERAAYCEKHYVRIRRNGTSERVLPAAIIGQTRSTSDGYVVQLVGKEHPLARADGYVLQHRLRMYEVYGDGPLSCAMCGAGEAWDTCHVDHINCIRDDNRLTNIRVTCARCNVNRGRDKGIITRRKNGRMITAHGRTRNINDWADDIGITSQSIGWRIARGWSLEDVVSKPRGKFGPASSKHSKPT